MRGGEHGPGHDVVEEEDGGCVGRDDRNHRAHPRPAPRGTLMRWDDRRF
jgi:hypothetical protein